ncbi:hypothetical protein KKIDH5335_22990 [Vibrio fluvialis]|nr:hypothetical protein KKIDH5335_22990 [Vibrio fluvialis]
MRNRLGADYKVIKSQIPDGICIDFAETKKELCTVTHKWQAFRLEINRLE